MGGCRPNGIQHAAAGSELVEHAIAKTAEAFAA